MLFRLLILLIQLEKVDYNTKIDKIEKKIPDHDKYITTLELNKFLGAIFDERLKEAKLATNNVRHYLKII